MFWPLEVPEASEASFSGEDWQWVPPNKQDAAQTWGSLDTWITHPHRRPGERQRCPLHDHLEGQF